jgi:hypothetical protein
MRGLGTAPRWLLGKPPNCRSGELDAIADRVPYVQRVATSRPIHFRFDRHLSRLQVRAPTFDVALWEPECHVARPMGAMLWDYRPTRWRSRIGRGLRIEEEDHPVATAKEDVPPRLLAEHFQPDDLPVEVLCSFQIRTVEGGLKHARRLQSRRWRSRDLLGVCLTIEWTDIPILFITP